MVITLCGSARFEPWFHLWNEILTLSGHTVFGLSVYPSFKGEKNWYTEQEKTILDKAHLDKIKLSDGILVLNKFAYIGESTLKEIEFARENNKQLFVLESWGKGRGIGSLHYAEIQYAAQRYGVHSKSPIDTFFPHFEQWYDLLPKAGSFRSALVNRVDELENKIYSMGERKEKK